MISHLAEVPGFTFNGINAGLKKENPDLAVIHSANPCQAAAAFTRNLVIAEPIKVCREQMAGGQIQTVVINSKNANACTGEKGAEAVRKEIDLVADEYQVDREHVFIASTGVIGRPFPTEKVLAGISKIRTTLQHSAESSDAAARAIMTTDTFAKGASQQFEYNGNQYHLAGIAKGSGMIHPNMGTMLSFVITDHNLSAEMLKKALNQAVDRSFNMISIDGDTSTNDCVLVMANGLADEQQVTDSDDPRFAQFCEKLTDLLQELARQIVEDGEGVTKMLEYEVKGLETEEECRQIIRTISTSLLVKTAFFGKDPNWGRLFAAAGRAGVEFNPDKTDLYFGFDQELPLLKGGQPVPLDEPKARQMLEQRNIKVTFDFHQGDASAFGWGSDLSYDYVKINAEYTT